MFERALSWIGSAKKPGQASAEDTGTHETTGGEPGDGVGPVCIGVVEGPLRAEIARTYLEQAGISVYLQGEALGSAAVEPLNVISLHLSKLTHLTPAGL